jgi:hypothetical protein
MRYPAVAGFFMASIVEQITETPFTELPSIQAQEERLLQLRNSIAIQIPGGTADKNVYIIQDVPLVPGQDFAHADENITKHTCFPVIFVTDSRNNLANLSDIQAKVSHIKFTDQLTIAHLGTPIQTVPIKASNSAFHSVNIGNEYEQWRRVGKNESGSLFALGVSLADEKTTRAFSVVLPAEWTHLVGIDGSLVDPLVLRKRYENLTKLMQNGNTKASLDASARFTELLSTALLEPDRLMNTIMDNMKRLHVRVDNKLSQPILHGKIGKEKFNLQVEYFFDSIQIRIHDINIPKGNLMRLQSPISDTTKGDLIIRIHQEQDQISFLRYTEQSNSGGEKHKKYNASSLVDNDFVFAVIACMDA